jgi:hypothetical protein
MSNIPSTPPVPNICLSNQLTGPIFYGGAMQLFYSNSSLYLSADGANGIIESGNSNSNMGGLLLNYLCGKDVYVGNANSGNLTANKNLYVNGKLGVGTNNPQYQLDVNGTSNFSGPVAINLNNASLTNAILSSVLNNYQLIVNGKVLATDFFAKVTSNWPDYVFDNNYKLMSIEELEKYIKQNRHLPHIPKEQEIKENGLSFVDIIKQQQQTIEELSLYIIQLSKEIKQLKEKIKDK